MKCQCLYIHRDREYNSPLRNFHTGEDRMTGQAFCVKTQTKSMCLKIKRTFKNDTRHWKEGAVALLG